MSYLFIKTSILINWYSRNEGPAITFKVFQVMSFMKTHLTPTLINKNQTKNLTTWAVNVYQYIHYHIILLLFISIYILWHVFPPKTRYQFPSNFILLKHVYKVHKLCQCESLKIFFGHYYRLRKQKLILVGNTVNVIVGNTC